LEAYGILIGQVQIVNFFEPVDESYEDPGRDMLCTGCTRLEFILRDSQVGDVALCTMSPLKMNQLKKAMWMSL
jgi:hypothetical protein